MDASEVTDVCRLCPERTDLIDVFNHPSDGANLRDSIEIATGIKIYETDLISTKVCQRCKSIILRMAQYRHDAIKRDKDLREKCGFLLSSNGIGLHKKFAELNHERPHSLSVEKNNILHESVSKLYSTYPKIKIPRQCFKLHVDPVIVLERNEAEQYWRDHGLSEKSDTNSQSTSKKNNGSNNIENNSSSDEDVVTGAKRKKLHDRVIRDSDSDSEMSKKSKADSNDQINVIPNLNTPTKAKRDNVEDNCSTPKVTAIRSQPLFQCHICTTVRYSEFELRRHIVRQHMVCQFCKRKFKSLGTKEIHQKEECLVRNTLETSLPTVELKPVHKDMEVRMKYSAAFADFEPVIPSLITTGSNLEAITAKGSIIVLSDDDEYVETKLVERPGTPSVTSNTSVSSSDGMKKSVFVLSPNLVFALEAPEKLEDFETEGQLITHFLKNVIVVANQAVQTYLPTNSDIRQLGHKSWIFYNIQDYLIYCDIDINIEIGTFRIFFDHIVKSRTINKKLWNLVPLYHERKSTTSAISAMISNPSLPTASSNFTDATSTVTATTVVASATFNSTENTSAVTATTVVATVTSKSTVATAAVTATTVVATVASNSTVATAAVAATAVVATVTSNSTVATSTVTATTVVAANSSNSIIAASAVTVTTVVATVPTATVSAAHKTVASTVLVPAPNILNYSVVPNLSLPFLSTSVNEAALQNVIGTPLQFTTQNGINMCCSNRPNGYSQFLPNGAITSTTHSGSASSILTAVPNIGYSTSLPQTINPSYISPFNVILQPQQPPVVVNNMTPRPPISTYSRTNNCNVQVRPHQTPGPVPVTLNSMHTTFQASVNALDAKFGLQFYVPLDKTADVSQTTQVTQPAAASIAQRRKSTPAQNTSSHEATRVYRRRNAKTPIPFRVRDIKELQ